MVKTQSELLFEEYLRARRLTEFEFEKNFPGVKQKPDYCLIHGDREILLEVKEFKAPRQLSTNRAMTFDPFPRMREKINAGRRKFRDLKDYPCGLVFHNLGNPLVSLDDPLMIWGAMLGNPGVSIPVDTASGKALDDLSRPVFTTGGKMVRYAEGSPVAAQNTTISAILVLSHLGVGSRRFHARYSSEKRGESDQKQRILNCLALMELMERTRGTECDVSLKELRVVVHENPYATIRLPQTLFQGPYDERYGVGSDHSVQRFYTGKKLTQLEEEENVAGVQRSPISRFVKKGRSK